MGYVMVIVVVSLDDGCITRFVNSDAFGHARVLLYVYVGGSGGGWSSLLSAWRPAFESRICCESVWKFVGVCSFFLSWLCDS